MEAARLRLSHANHISQQQQQQQEQGQQHRLYQAEEEEEERTWAASGPSPGSPLLVGSGLMASAQASVEPISERWTSIAAGCVMMVCAGSVYR